MYADAILLLGLHMPGGVPPEELGLRVAKAAYAWREGFSPMVIAGGGRREDEPAPEAAWMAAELQKLGVPASAIREEGASLNTLQNAEGAKAILDTFGGTSVLVVTGDYHMARALRTCRDVGLKAKGLPVRTGGGVRVRAKYRLNECLGWLEYKLGGQRGEPSAFAKWVRKRTGS